MSAFEFPFSQESISVPDHIVDHNMIMLNGSMHKLLSRESMGGNAGTCIFDGKTYSCVAANGWANKQTGEIVVFDNLVNPSEDFLAENAHFVLRVVVGIDFETNLGFDPIVDFLEKEHFSQTAVVAIELAIAKYNEKHAVRRPLSEL